jgi:hypothetical protein
MCCHFFIALRKIVTLKRGAHELQRQNTRPQENEDSLSSEDRSEALEDCDMEKVVVERVDTRKRDQQRMNRLPPLVNAAVSTFPPPFSRSKLVAKEVRSIKLWRATDGGMSSLSTWSLYKIILHLDNVGSTWWIV